MFRLTREKYTDALTSAENMEKTLQTEMQNLEGSSNILASNWLGLQAENNLGTMNTSLKSDSHAKALGYTHGMVSIMGEYLPEIGKMMAKREQIGEQLKQDDYAEPDLTSFHEGELIVSYDYIDNVKADAEGAVLYGDSAAEILEEMIEDASCCEGEYINLDEVRTLFEEGKKKLHRVTHYKDEFADFGKKMSDMEYNMSLDLTNMMTEQGDPYLIFDSLTRVNINQDTRVEQMEKYDEELENLKLVKEIEEEYGEEVSSKVAEMLKKDENGNYGFEELLHKDIEELTEEDIDALTYLYTEIYEDIETAENEDACMYKIMLAEQFSQELFGVDVETETTGTMYSMTTVIQYYAVSNDELIQEMLYRMDEEGSLACNYLYQISGTKILAGEKILRSDSTLEVPPDVKTATVSLEFNENGIGMDFNIEYNLQMDSVCTYITTEEHYLSGVNMALKYVDSLEQKDYANLLEIGYDKEDIAMMFAMNHNQDDVALVKNLMSGNEADIFKLNPELYSEETKSVLASYAIKLGLYDIEQNNGCERLTEFTNHMIVYDDEHWYNEEYMKIMSVYCGLEREAILTAMWNSDGIDYDLIETNENVDAITGFFQTLCLEGVDLRTNHAMLTGRLLSLYVPEITLTDKEVEYDIIGYTKTPETEGNRICHVVAQTHWSPLQANSDIFAKEMNEIEDKIEGLWASYAADAFICAASLVDKNTGLALKTMKAAYDGSVKGMETSSTRIKVNGKGLSDSALCVMDIFGIYADYQQKKESLQEDLEEQAGYSMVAWFYSGNMYYDSAGEAQYYNTGIYNGYVIEAIKEWNGEGMSSFCTEDVDEIAEKLLNIEGGEVEINEDRCFGLNDVKGYDEDEEEDCKKDAMILILYGNKGITIDGKTYTGQYDNVAEIPPELFSACIRDIDSVVGGNQSASVIEEEWQNKLDTLKTIEGK